MVQNVGGVKVKIKIRFLIELIRYKCTMSLKLSYRSNCK